jgi:cytochrome c oxidase subunit 3
MRDEPSFNSESRETPGPREPSFRMSPERLLVILAFVVIGVLFAGTLVAYAVTRMQVRLWRPANSPGLPFGLFGSTLMLAGLSASMQRALVTIRANREDAFRKALWVALLFAVAFVVGQGINWTSMARSQAGLPRATLFAFTFYLLTGLHAAHVIGGLVPLSIVIRRAREREYSSSRYEGVRFCVWYWHYLGAIWLVLLAVMFSSQ